MSEDLIAVFDHMLATLDEVLAVPDEIWAVIGEINVSNAGQNRSCVCDFFSFFFFKFHKLKLRHVKKSDKK